MSGSPHLVARIEHTWAEAERRVVDTVGRLDPSRRSMTFDLADGVAVLAGPGLYVNQVMGAGLTAPIDGNDIDHLEEHAAEVGVPPAFDVCDATLEQAVALLQDRSYRPDGTRTALAHDLGEIPEASAAFTIEFIGPDGLPNWQEATAEGWGHYAPDRRLVSDLYAAGAAEVDDPGLMLARHADGAIAGAAMLRIEGDVATLGGMSTRPEWRRQGVQTALVAARLRLARNADCRVATSSVEPGSGSHRNLERLGFRHSHSRTTWVKA